MIRRLIPVLSVWLMALYLIESAATASSANTALKQAVVARPHVAKVSPRTGPLAAGTRVTVIGTGFRHVKRVMFGTVRGTSVSVKSSRKLVVTAPAHKAGTFTVRVVTRRGTSPIVRAARFTYLAASGATVPRPDPVISKAVLAVNSISPATGSTLGGTPVVLTGTRLDHATSVWFGGVEVDFKILSPTQIKVASTPKHENPGSVTVVVKNATERDDSKKFTYGKPPKLGEIWPTSGSTLGSDPATISYPLQAPRTEQLQGEHLAGATSVVMTDSDGKTSTNLPIVSATDTIVEVKTPAHLPGAVTMTVATPFGSSSWQFTYVATPPHIEQIANIGPSGSINGGYRRTITGWHLNDARLTIGGVDVPYTWHLDGFGRRLVGEQLDFVVPAHAAGAVNLVLTTFGGQETRTWTYVAAQPPTISTAPLSGSIAGGNVITLSGTNLYDIVGAWVGDTYIPLLPYLPSQTQIEMPPHAAGQVPVMIVTVDGSANTTYTYVEPSS